MQVAIIGAGSFGTVLADIAATTSATSECTHVAKKWCVQSITLHRNPPYHPDLELHASILASNNLSAVVSGADLVLLSVPSKSMDAICQELSHVIDPGVPLLSTTKGIRADGFKLMSQVLSERLSNHPVGVLSGPNLAHEIAQRHLTASVVASESSEVRQLARDAFATKYLRLYSSEDLISVELGGALKNIYAIAAGLADGLDVGQKHQGTLDHTCAR